MRYLKTYKLFESSEFFDKDYIDELLDKISDSGIDSLSDIEKNRLKLFSEDDKEVIDTIERMGDITNQFKELNQKIRDIQSKGGDAKHLMEDWLKLNDELVTLEQSFRKWGIELGDTRLDRLMRKTRPDAYNNIFESSIYGQSEGFDDQDVLDVVRDILLELEDIDIECRMWINGYRGGVIKNSRLLKSFELEINYTNDVKIKNIVDDVRSRLESYLTENGYKTRVTHEDVDFLHLEITKIR